MKVLLIKLGGSIVHELEESFFSSIKYLQQEGFQVAIVHGGGPDIDEMLNTLQIQPSFHNGLRKTTQEVLSVVELVLSGKTNRTIVSLLKKNGLPAMGLHGNDAILEGDYIDQASLGEVGEITNVNSDLVKHIMKLGFIPVLTPLAISKTGQTLNINADMAAGAVAKALDAESCVFVTDVKGVLKNGTLLDQMTAEDAAHLIDTQVIYGGMIPKVRTALKTLETGIKHVRIVSGKEHFFKNGRWVGTSFLEKVGIGS